ncbi:hypothetical protein L7F22_019140 [Adiantum nelumboides]|nr:hypothetical protein [Adiantum nelumboides]
METNSRDTQPSAKDARLLTLQRESKAFQQKFRMLLDEDDAKPAKPNLEFARKELRNVYLKLLFHHTFSARTRGIESSIWIETTHPFVQLYREQLAAIETKIRALKESLKSQENDKKGKSNAAQHAEEAFWRDLAARIASLFEVTEALPNLTALGMMNGDVSNSHTGMERIIGVIDVGIDEQILATQPANRQRLIEIIHKALISCGDLARYRELYREESKDESSQSRTGPHRGGRGGRGGRVLAAYKNESFPSVYNYYRALCVSEPFEKAKKNLEKTLRRASAKWEESGNLNKYSASDSLFTSAINEEEDNNVSVSDVLQELVVLHAAYFTRRKALILSTYPFHCLRKISILLHQRALHTDTIVQLIITAIASLWSRRLWRGNDSTTKEDSKKTTSSIVAEQSILLHLCGLSRVLFEIGASETNEAMANTKSQQSNPSSARQISAVLRRMLPAVRVISKWLKLHMNYIQRSRQQSSQSTSVSTNGNSIDSATSAKVSAQLANGIDDFWATYVHFINVIRFAFPFETLPSLGTSVGQSGMNGLDFEEDRDLRGFTPLKNASLNDVKTHLASNSTETGRIEVSATSNLHPNEEQLIRIADILIDAKVIAETESSPVIFDDAKNMFLFASATGETQFAFTNDLQDPIQIHSSDNANENTADTSITRPYSDDEWRNASESSEDAVDLAMRAVDERTRTLNEDGDQSDLRVDDDEEDEDEIILIPAHQKRSQSSAVGEKSGPVTPQRGDNLAPVTGSSLLKENSQNTTLMLKLLNIFYCKF